MEDDMTGDVVTFDIFLRRSTDTPPPEGAGVYWIGRNGAFMVRRTSVFEAIVPTPEVPDLAPITEEVRYLLPQIPPEQTARVLTFLRSVFERWRTEAMLFVLWNPARQAFGFLAPSQDVRGGHCRYTGERLTELGIPDGVIVAGSIHSHGSSHAFHSGMDTHDEVFQDGVHVVFGSLDRNAVEVTASIAVGGKRYPIDPMRVFAGLRRFGVRSTVPLSEFQLDRILAEWANMLTPERAVILRTPEGRSEVRALVERYRAHSSPAVHGTHGNASENGYVLDLPSGIDFAMCAPDPLWFDMVYAPTECALADIRVFLNLQQCARDPGEEPEPNPAPSPVVAALTAVDPAPPIPMGVRNGPYVPTNQSIIDETEPWMPTTGGVHSGASHAVRVGQFQRAALTAHGGHGTKRREHVLPVDEKYGGKG